MKRAEDDIRQYNPVVKKMARLRTEMSRPGSRRDIGQLLSKYLELNKRREEDIAPPKQAATKTDLEQMIEKYATPKDIIVVKKKKKKRIQPIVTPVKKRRVMRKTPAKKKMKTEDEDEWADAQDETPILGRIQAPPHLLRSGKSYVG